MKQVLRDLADEKQARIVRSVVSAEPWRRGSGEVYEKRTL